MNHKHELWKKNKEHGIESKARQGNKQKLGFKLTD